MKQIPLGMRLRSDAVFENFVTGVHSELLAMLGQDSYAPLWIWGAHGAGKTHLLQAACAAAADATAAYFPLRALAGMPAEALSGFERCRLLCVDDVEVVAGDSSWEAALFALFNAAVDRRCRLVLAAAAAPRQLAWRLEDLRSRATACLVYQLHELDESGRIEALRLRAAQRGLELPRETAEYLLKRLPRDLPSLFGILDRLDEASLVAQRRLTVPFIRDALEQSAKT